MLPMQIFHLSNSGNKFSFKTKKLKLFNFLHSRLLIFAFARFYGLTQTLVTQKKGFSFPKKFISKSTESKP